MSFGWLVVEVNCRNSAGTTQYGAEVVAELAADVGELVWVPQWIAGPRCLAVVVVNVSESLALGGSPAELDSAAAFLAQNAVILLFVLG